MARKNWLTTIVPTTGVNWCWTRLTSRNCCRKSARPSARLRADAWNKRCRKAGPCSSRHSPAGNLPATKPHISGNCWTPTGPESCARPSVKRWNTARPESLRWPSSSASTSAPDNDGHPRRSTSVNTRNWLLSTCNPRTWRSTMNSPSKTTTKNDLTAQLQQIGLRALPENLDDFLARASKARWSSHLLLEELCRSELQERSRRSLERRLRVSAIKSFKPLADFEWNWPTKIDRDVIERALTLDFLQQARNLVLVGRNGLGKTLIAKNICHAAVLAGHSVLFRTAPAILEDLQSESIEGRRRKLRSYANVGLLCIDEVGYLSYDDKAADILFEVINRRYERKSLIVTTNRIFKEWNEVFPNATCIATMLDRLLHHADVTVIEGDSYRVRESEQEAAARRRKK